MKIAVIHSYYSSRSPSGENVAVDLQVEALLSAGHDVRQISRRTDIQEKSKLYSLTAALNAAGFGGYDPTAELSAFQPDVVHVHNMFPNIGGRWLRTWGHKTIATMHNFRSVCASATLWRDGHDCMDCMTKGSANAVVNRCYRGSAIATAPLAYATRDSGSHSPALSNARILLTLNTSANKLFAEQFPRCDVRTVPNFVDTPERLPSKPERRWIYAGRLTHEKGIHKLVERWPDSEHLTIVGTGPLKPIIADLTNNRSNITLLGSVSHEKVGQLLSNCYGLVIPSLWSEGIPTVALEALSRGTPIIISSKCSSAEELVRGRAGTIWDPLSDTNSLHLHLEEIAQNQDTYRLAARTTFLRHYSRETWLKSIQLLYNSLQTD